MAPSIPPEALLRSIAESSPDAIIGVTTDSTVTFWNRAAELLFGYSAKEMIGQSSRRLVPPDARAEAEIDEVQGRATQGPGATTYDTRRVTKDGRTIPVSITVVPILDGGMVAGFCTIVSDLASRRRIEREAFHLAAIVQFSDDAIVSKDLDGFVTSWNAGAERLFGYTAAEMIGQPVSRIIPADRLTEETTVLTHVRAGLTVDHFETVRRHKDGRFLDISLTVSPIRSPAGVIVGASKIARDITERKRTARRLEEEIRTVETLNRVGSILAATLDQDAIVHEVTTAATDVSGATFGAFEATFRGEGVVRIDDVLRDPRFGRTPPFDGMPPGHGRVRSYLAVPVSTASGTALGGLVFGHAEPGMFTERHERVVAGIAGWAAVALENARLFRESEATSRMKDEFLAVLSHELRTPLNAIMGWAGVLLGASMDEPLRRKALETIQRNATLQAQLIEDLLDVSRIIAGKLSLKEEAVDLAAVVAAALDDVKPAAFSKGIGVPSEVAGPVVVSGDARRLQQIVWNLLSNAIKFTPPGGQVRVALDRHDGRARVRVSDSGQGIRPELLPQIFDRFRQGDSSSTRSAGGLGLGLGIVRHLAELHRGTVEAASAGLGRGATFTVELPLYETIAESAPAAKGAPRAWAGRLVGVRALIVDDEPDSADLLAFALRQSGAEVEVVSSALEALQRVTGDDFDVLLADIGMPGMDGHDLIQALRGLEADTGRPRQAAVAVTAYASERERQRALAAGFDWHVGKPVNLDDITTLIGVLAGRD
jgi:PAS domain S-box-containing protein